MITSLIVGTEHRVGPNRGLLNEQDLEMFRHVFVSQDVNINLIIYLLVRDSGWGSEGIEKSSNYYDYPSGKEFDSPGAALLWIGSVARAQMLVHISASVERWFVMPLVIALLCSFPSNLHPQNPTPRNWSRILETRISHTPIVGGGGFGLLFA